MRKKEKMETAKMSGVLLVAVDATPKNPRWNNLAEKRKERKWDETTQTRSPEEEEEDEEEERRRRAKRRKGKGTS